MGICSKPAILPPAIAQGEINVGAGPRLLPSGRRARLVDTGRRRLFRRETHNRSTTAGEVS